MYWWYNISGNEWIFSSTRQFYLPCEISPFCWLQQSNITWGFLAIPALAGVSSCSLQSSSREYQMQGKWMQKPCLDLQNWWCCWHHLGCGLSSRDRVWPQFPKPPCSELTLLSVESNRWRWRLVRWTQSLRQSGWAEHLVNKIKQLVFQSNP